MFLILYLSTAQVVLRAGFIYSGPLDDYGWTYNHNLGRIHAVQLAAEEGITVVTEVRESVEGGDAMLVIEDMVRRGVGLVFATSFVFHDVTFEAAERYPEVDFVHMTGYYSGLPNFATASGKLYQARYLSGVVAGGETTTGRVGYVASVKIPEVYRNINSYYLGAMVGAGSRPVEVIVIWIDTFNDPVKEAAATEVLARLGCGVISYHTDTKASPVMSKKLGVYSTGSNGDQRLSVGESVLTSANFDWSPIYAEYMARSARGTFKSHENRSLWYGYNQGAVLNYPPSDAVSPTTRSTFTAEQHKLRHTSFDPFCTQSACLSEFSLSVEMTYLLENITDVGSFVLPGACPPGTRYAEVVTRDPIRYITRCQKCPPGTASGAPIDPAIGVRSCLICPAGYYAGEGVGVCAPCPEGTYSNKTGVETCVTCGAGRKNYGVGNVACPFSEDDLTVYVVVAAVIGVLLVAVIVGAVMWLRHSQRSLSKSHSNQVVAQSCAESIANMNLEAVAYIKDIKKPNPIQVAFIKIIDNLVEFRKYLPQSLVVDAHPGSAYVSPLVVVKPPMENGECAVLMTGIQHSEVLWDTNTEEMQHNVDVYHRRVKEVVAACNGHELRTVSDNVMAVFANPDEAVRSGLAMQNALYATEWSPWLASRPQCPEVPGVWNGLRVRIGVHYGAVECVPDTSTGSYDCTGPAVTIATRFEAICAPGCVTLTEQLFDTLSLSNPAPHAHTIYGACIIGLTGRHNIITLAPPKFPDRLQDLDISFSHSPGGGKPRTSRVRQNHAYMPVAACTVGVIKILFPTADYLHDPDKATMQHVLSTVVLQLERTSGSVLTVFNQLVVVSWNTGIPSSSHFHNGLKWAELCGHVFSGLPHVTGRAGIATGEASYGYIGTHKQLFLSIVGATVDTAYMASCVAVDLGVASIACGQGSSMLGLASYFSRPVLKMRCPNTTPVIAYQVEPMNSTSLNTSCKSWSMEFAVAFLAGDMQACIDLVGEPDEVMTRVFELMHTSWNCSSYSAL